MKLFFVWLVQESGKDVVVVTFSQGTSVHHTLSLHLPEYSGVLVDCLQGEVLHTLHHSQNTAW